MSKATTATKYYQVQAADRLRSRWRSEMLGVHATYFATVNNLEFLMTPDSTLWIQCLQAIRKTNRILSRTQRKLGPEMWEILLLLLPGFCKAIQVMHPHLKRLEELLGDVQLRFMIRFWNLRVNPWDNHAKHDGSHMKYKMLKGEWLKSLQQHRSYHI